MVVGEDVTVGGDDDAGADAALTGSVFAGGGGGLVATAGVLFFEGITFFRDAEVAEEEGAEGGRDLVYVFLEVHDTSFGGRGGEDGDDTGENVFDDGGVAHLELAVGGQGAFVALEERAEFGGVVGFWFVVVFGVVLSGGERGDAEGGDGEGGDDSGGGVLHGLVRFVD